MTSESKQPSDLILRLTGIAYRDEAKAVTVRADDLRAVLAALSAPEPAAQGDGWDARGGSLWLDREQWGTVIDALIEHRAGAAKRKNVNPDSTSDVRADECDDLIGKITRAAESLTAPPAQPAERVPADGLQSALREATEVLQMVADSGVELPPNWRWPLLDELSGYAYMLAASPAPSQPAERVPDAEDAERWRYLVRENNKGGRGAFRICWFDERGDLCTSDGVSIDGKDEQAIVRIIDKARLTASSAPSEGGKGVDRG